MKYIILLNIAALMSCQRIIDDTHIAEQVLHDVAACEEQIEKDLESKVYTVQSGKL